MVVPRSELLEQKIGLDWKWVYANYSSNYSHKLHTTIPSCLAFCYNHKLMEKIPNKTKT